MTNEVRSPRRAVWLVAAALVAFVALGTAVVLARRTQSPAASAAAARPATSASKDSPVVAEVEGAAILARDVDKAIGIEIDRLEQQLYDMRRQQLDRIIGEKLIAREAARRNVTVEALEGTEIAQKTRPVTDQDVDAFYESAKDRLPPNQPNIKMQIRAYLMQQGAQARREAFVNELRSKANVTVKLDPPPVTRHDVEIAGAPVRGPENAPVTIVEFSDFHCPFCRRAKPTIDQVMAKYGDKVRLVYKDLPLDSLHPAARRASEAGRCAHEQGKFWPFHDLLFERGADASDQTLSATATQAGLDLPAFTSCLASGKHRDAVAKDVEEAESLGITGTPAFFVNGRLLSGAQPLEAFVKVVDEELTGRVPTR